MIKEIGKVKLNYQHYLGTDLYSDGAVEDEIFEIVKNNSPNEYNRVIIEKQSWPVFYHLSHIRENIVDWLPITKEQNVLEVGAGCGAITGCLARKAMKVTCVELSEKRSLINAYRNKDKDNIEILLGNFEEVEQSLSEQFDYITLIGVLEYGESYISGEKPYETFLRTMKKHLKPGGRIVIAIENKLGMKYWAGCKEDHTARYFEGLEGYPNTLGVKTFSKLELEQLIYNAGFTNYKFYYPYPDYKLPHVIYSDNYLPKVGELNNNIRNFDNERLLLFDESKVFNMIIQEKQFPLFSNSYLTVITNGGNE